MNFLEQAARAERLARTVMDAFAADALMQYARECRELAARPADFATGPSHPVTMSDTAWWGHTGRQLAF